MAGSSPPGQRSNKPQWGQSAPPPKAKPPAAKQAQRPAKAGTKAPAHGAQPAFRSAALPERAKAKPAGTAKPKNGRKNGPKRAAPARAKARPARKRGQRGREFRARYAVVHDTDAPHVRLGLAWFAVAFVAIAAGPFSTAVVYGIAGAAAGAQASRAWGRLGTGASDVMAAGGAGLMAGGACFGAGGAGLGIIAAVVLAFFAAATDARSPHPRMSDIGYTLQCSLIPGAAALSMVLLARVDQGSAIALLLLVSAFETGDYLIGTGATNPYEGPAAGAASVMVVTFIVSTLPISTLSFGEAWALGGAVLLLAPLGQYLASAVLPTATTPASALRRLDSLLLAAPLWAWAVGLAIAK